LAPELREHVAVNHVFALGQIAASAYFAVSLPLKEFLMFWGGLPAAFGLWHFWRVMKGQYSQPGSPGPRRLAPGE
jgi:hypothetical protein